MNNHVKSENPDFNIFSVEHLDEAEPFSHIKSEPRVSTTILTCQTDSPN